MATDTSELFQRLLDEYYPGGRLPEVRPLSLETLALLSKTRLDQQRIPVVAAPVPTGYIEMRSGSQRVGTWLDGTSDHDPGDEDRSGR